MKKGLLCILLVIMVFTTACASKDIMRPDDWVDKYPDIYASYLRNSEMTSTTYGGSEQIDYLEAHPNLRTFYDGYGFSKEYARARGHIYAVEDVLATARPKPGASCLACKTADFTEALNEGGVGVNGIDFDEFVESLDEIDGISCFDCHKNSPGSVDITRQHIKPAIGLLDDVIVNPVDMACAQCHVEYYLDPETKEVILPWHNGLGTDGMLAYYDEIGFADWEHPATGSQLLKAQHPEFETFQGSIHHNQGLSCIDCHMPELENQAGEKYLAHQWTSPLKELDNAVCFTCHTDETESTLINKVEDVQKDVKIKRDEVSDLILELIQKLAKAVETGSHSQDIIEQARDLHRKAQFKWDFVFVENGEGYHNSSLAHQNLDEAKELAKKGIELFK